MIDHILHVTNVVKDELAKQCTANGVDKSEAGFVVGGGGVIAPVIDNDGKLVGFAPAWSVVVSMRSRLIGMSPIAGSLPIYDVLPPDEQLRAVVGRLVRDVADAREQQFNGTGGL
jgi:hypothetical protein